MTYSVLAYYAIVPIEDPKAEVARHKEFFKTTDFKGRIYISEQGINGQASGSVADAEKYMEWLKADPRFEGQIFKIHPSKEHVFPRMTVPWSSGSFAEIVRSCSVAVSIVRHPSGDR